MPRPMPRPTLKLMPRWRSRLKCLLGLAVYAAPGVGVEGWGSSAFSRLAFSSGSWFVGFGCMVLNWLGKRGHETKMANVH